MIKAIKLVLTINIMISAGIVAGQPFKSDTIDILNYTIYLDMRHLSLKEVRGTAELTIVSVMPLINSFSLDFKKLTTDSVFLDGMSINTYHHDGDELFVTLPAPLTPSDTFKLRVVYHGVPYIEQYNWGGFHFLGDSTLAFNLGVAFEDYPHNYGRVWFPCIDDFIDRATYDVIVRTKSSHKAVCGGVLHSTNTLTDGSILWHWKLEQPIPTYLASIAVGDFAVIPGTYIGINGQIPSLLYVKPQDSTKAVGSFSNLNQMMTIFENRYGAYKWPRIGYVGTTKGAMEHATNIAMPRTSITGSTASDWLIAHELSHHWFGNLMTCATAEDMWINEGWARYSEAIYFEGISGWEAYKEYIMQIQKDVLNFAHTKSSGGDGAFYPLYPVPQTHTYGTTVYDKGALIAHTLRGYLGDSLFFDGIKALLTNFSFKPANSYQIRDFLSAHTGVDLTSFFDSWVFTAGFPHFSIDSVQSTPYNNGFNITVFARQKMMGRNTYTDDNIFEIGFYKDINIREVHRMSLNSITGQQTFFIPFKPVLVVLDPEDRIADAITAETSLISDAITYQFTKEFFRLKVNSITDTALIRVEHSFVAPDTFPNPIQGLTISPNRYWKISGIIPTGVDMDGLFSFGTGNQFDNALITNTQDSLVILFRNDPGELWQSIPFTRTPSPTSGTITVSGLRMGEYTLAKWDKKHIGINETEEAELFSVYPNPTDGKLYIGGIPFSSTTIEIFNNDGKCVFTKNIPVESNNQIIQLPGSLADDVYFLKVKNNKGIEEHTKKIVLCRK